jgi:hypothetical protein
VNKSYSSRSTEVRRTRKEVGKSIGRETVTEFKGKVEGVSVTSTQMSLSTTQRSSPPTAHPQVVPSLGRLPLVKK